jgi:hypothetical protein
VIIKQANLWFGVLFAMMTSVSHAITVLVPGSSWSSFTIDMDGNGQNDFVGVSTASSNLTGTFYSDQLQSNLLGPTTGFSQYTGRWVLASNPSSVNLNGTWTVPTLTRTLNNGSTTGFSFYSHLNQQSYYTLMVGNSGNSGDAAMLIAFYVDGRDYFANNANPIKFNYGVYGPVSATTGSNTATVDFASLAVPEPGSASLLILGLAAVLARSRRCRR